VSNVNQHRHRQPVKHNVHVAGRSALGSQEVVTERSGLSSQPRKVKSVKSSAYCRLR